MVTRAALTSSRPPKTDKPTEDTRSLRPPPSDAVKEVLQALEKKSPSKVAPSIESERATPSTAPKPWQFQISVSTLVLGFSTTVLAVVVIMMLIMRSQSAATTEPKAQGDSVRAVTKNEHDQVAQVPAVPRQVSDATDVKVDEQSANSPQLGPPAAANGVKTGIKTRANKPSGSNNKVTSSGDSAEADEANAAGQKHPKHYVPNDL